MFSKKDFLFYFLGFNKAIKDVRFKHKQPHLLKG